MTTSQSTVDFLLDQMSGAGNVHARKMFGDYAIYLETKVVALVCDDHLFIKPTEISSQYLGDEHGAPPFSGAKNWLKIPEDKWEEIAWLREFVQETARVLPEPKPKKKRGGK